MQLFHVIFAIVSHPKTRDILAQCIQFIVDFLFAVALVAVSVVLSVITLGEDWARKKINEYTRKKNLGAE